MCLFSLNSCEKNDLPAQSIDSFSTKEVFYKGLPAEMPISFPQDLISYQVDDIKAIGLNTANKAKTKITSKKTLSEIIDKIYAKYPSFDTFNPKEYKRFFPKLSEKEITENSEYVLSYIEKLMAYDVAQTFANEGDGIVEIKPKQSKNARFGDWFLSAWNAISQCEVWYYLAHLRMDQGGIYASKAIAYNLQESKYPNAPEHTKGDAFRHGVWGTLVGKYACYRYGSVSEAFIVAYGFLDSHECGQSSLESKMDHKNNLVSMFYYLQNSESYKNGLWNYNVRVNKTDQQISTEIDEKGYINTPDAVSLQNVTTDNLVHIY